MAALTRTRRGLVSELVLTTGEDGVASDCVVNFDNVHTLPRSTFRRRATELSAWRMMHVCGRSATTRLLTATSRRPPTIDSATTRPLAATESPDADSEFRAVRTRRLHLFTAVRPFGRTHHDNLEQAVQAAKIGGDSRVHGNLGGDCGRGDQEVDCPAAPGLASGA